MPRKKDFWELADSTILGRTKKTELLQIARTEHRQIEALRAQIESHSKQTEAQNRLVDQLRSERDQEGAVHQQVLENLLQVFEHQQHNHEEEVDRLQDEARNWEKVAQDYGDAIVTYRTEISRLEAFKQQIKRFGQMPPLEAGQALIQWLFKTKTDFVEHCPNCGGVIASPDYQFCPHCGTAHKIPATS